MTLEINKEGLLITSANDPNNDQIYIYIDWGDGNILDWDGPYESEIGKNYRHSWTLKDTYIIKVKAKDTFGLESDEKEFEIKISNPRTRA